MEEAEVVLCNLRASVLSKSTYFQSSPYRVTREELVVRFNTSKAYHTELHNHVVNKFLCFFFCKNALLKITFNVNVKECRNTTYRHSSTVLCLNSSKVTKVQPLESFLSSCSWLRNIIAVKSSHSLHTLQSLNLLSKLFALADYNFSHCSVSAVSSISFLLLDEVIDTIKSNTAIVTYDTSTSVCIWQTSKDVCLTSLADLWSVYIKYSV